MLGIPLNRIVAFVGPYVSIASGIAATWLTVHVHALTTFHITQKSAAGALTTLGIFAVSTAVTWAGHQTWLKGHHIQLAQESNVVVVPPDQGDAGKP